MRSGSQTPGHASHLDGLTTRELEVLRLIGRGRSDREIATDLFISEHTAANHVRSILMKTQSANRTAAARYAMRHGLLEEELQTTATCDPSGSTRAVTSVMTLAGSPARAAARKIASADSAS